MDIKEVLNENNRLTLSYRTISNLVEDTLVLLANTIANNLPNYDNAIKSIEKTIVELELDKLPTWNDTVSNIRNVQVEFDSYVYQIIFYSTQIAFCIYKDGVEIGHLYYWDKYEKPLKMYFSKDASKINLYGLTVENFEDYMTGAIVLTTNMEKILEQASILFLNNLTNKMQELDKLKENISKEIVELEDELKKGRERYERMI